MATSFDAYVPTLLYWETGVKTTGLSGPTAFEKSRAKGFVNDPDDKGGATQSGVTLGTFRSVFGASKTVSDLKNITYAQWRYIMKRYWDACKADQLNNQSVAEIFVDWNINAGNAAIRRLQRDLGLKDDGIVGNKTLAALNASPQKTVFDKVKNSRVAYYNKIVVNNPSQKKFLAGWLSRVNSFTFSI